MSLLKKWLNVKQNSDLELSSFWKCSAITGLQLTCLFVFDILLVLIVISVMPAIETFDVS